ncbi:hypothetical protein [Chryseobacterium indoltheticum]|uniref:hypothetical protein n=1 Tax=Chryseobacterium indoltheticum TaxID=254 RepID=UPI003F49880D
MQLPDKKFTGYGTSEQDIALKYFFIVPDHFDADNISKKRLSRYRSNLLISTPIGQLILILLQIHLFKVIFSRFNLIYLKDI